MPGLYNKGEYDLAGFGVGIVDRKDIIDGSAIKPGDAVLGLESSGLHSNGYSLVRKVFSPKELKAYSKELLTPTRLYAKPVLALKKKIRINGIANITGGAFYDKIPRIIPCGMAVEIYKHSWQVPRIFTLIKKRGGMEDREIYRTLNMGIGMVLVISQSEADKAVSLLKMFDVKSFVIGKVVTGSGKIVIR
jgi:phosphoribosylformylglycinamidine cyclo-ligase